MGTLNLMRQEGILNSGTMSGTRVAILGTGSIGSFVSLVLAKMGIGQLSLWDPDTVSEHNIPNQWFRLSDVGTSKVSSLGKILPEFTGLTPELNQSLYHAQKETGLMVCCVDSMPARLKIWKTIRRIKPPLYIDTRMGAEVGLIYPVFPRSEKSCVFYEETLHPAEESYQAPCTERATCYCAAAMAGYVGSVIAGYIVNQSGGERIIPSSIMFDLVTYTFLKTYPPATVKE